jgi:hypothetical protein
MMPLHFPPPPENGGFWPFSGIACNRTLMIRKS